MARRLMVLRAKTRSKYTQPMMIDVFSHDLHYIIHLLTMYVLGYFLPIWIMIARYHRGDPKTYFMGPFGFFVGIRWVISRSWNEFSSFLLSTLLIVIIWAHLYQFVDIILNLDGKLLLRLDEFLAIYHCFLFRNASK